MFEADSKIGYMELSVYLHMGHLRKCVGDFQPFCAGFKRGVQNF